MSERPRLDPGSSPLLTDLYQLNMIEAYLAYGERKTAVFELFVRKLPARRGFLMAAGLEQALQFLEDLQSSSDDIEWLRSTGRFSERKIDYFANMRFTGDVHAMPEGTVFFANEPILRVTAPLPEAQLVEARLINILHFQSLIAREAPCRLWPPACTRRRSWPHGRACQLYRWLHRHGHRARRQALRHSSFRHHGAFLHRSP